MDIKSRVKGTIGQAIVKSILTSAGYRVVPFGVEETMREISVLKEDAYWKLKLPPVLRRMPDFIVATKKIKRVYLVEVKFRKNWTEMVKGSLFTSLQPQVKLWPNITLVVVFRSFKKAGAAIRCLHVASNAANNFLEVVHNGQSLNWKCVTEDHFLQLHEVFPDVGVADFDLTKMLDEIIGL